MDLGDRLLLFVHAPLGRSAALAPSVTPPHRRVENPHAVIDQPYELLCEPGEGKDQEQLDSSLEGARGAVGEGPAGVDGRQEGNRIDEPVAARHQAKVGEHEQTVERVHGSRLPREPVRQFTAIILQAERLAVPFVLLLHLGGPIAPAQVCDASGAVGREGAWLYLLHYFTCRRPLPGNHVIYTPPSLHAGQPVDLPTPRSCE